MEPSLHQCRAAAVMHAVKLLAGEERKNTTHVLTSNASRKLQLWLISKLGRMKDGPAAFEGLYIERGMSLWEAAIATSCSSGTLTPAVHIAKARTLRFEHGYPYIYIFLFIYLFSLFILQILNKDHSTTRLVFLQMQSINLHGTFPQGAKRYQDYTNHFFESCVVTYKGLEGIESFVHSRR